MTKTTVVSIGSSLVDIFIVSPFFKLQKTSDGLMLCQNYGAKIELESFQLFSGGGGSNTAVGFARLGFDSYLISETGKDTLATLVLKDLSQAEINLTGVVQERHEKTGGSVILVGPDGNRTVMVYRGAASLLDPIDLPYDLLLGAQWVHLSSINGRHATLKEIFEARRISRKISWNPGQRELILLASGQINPKDLPVDVLILNEQEWSLLGALHSVLITQIPIVVVTDGSRGGRYFHQNKELGFKALLARAVETTGAGDAFSVGFVAGHLHHLPIDRCIDLGLKNATSVIQHFGAKKGLLTKDELFSP